MRHRPAHLAVAAGLFASVVQAVPAAAATVPVLTAVSVDATAVTAPGTITVRYTAASDSPITGAQARYRTPRGQLRLVQLTLGSSGSGTIGVPSGSETGTWTLADVVLVNATGRTQVCSSAWAAIATGCTEVRDLGPDDVSVSGLPPEYDAPVLTAVGVSPSTPSTVTPGQQVTLSWTGSDTNLARVDAVFNHDDPAGAGHSLTLSSTDPAVLTSRQVTKTLGTDVHNGRYDLASITLYDVMGNAATYRRDGSASLSGGARTPTGSQLAFERSFTVTGSSVDTSFPVLRSIQARDRSLVLGDVLAVDYAIDDQQATLASVRLAYVASDYAGLDPVRQPAPKTGSINTPPSRLGSYRLERVTLDDGKGNGADYLRNGTIVSPDGRPRTHTLDLAALDFVVLPHPPVVRTRPRPRGAEVTVQIQNDDFYDATGISVVVEPGHRVVTMQKADLTSALQPVVISGLSNDTAYTVTARIQGPGGPSAPRSAKVTPMLTTNVTGPGDLDDDGHPDLVALDHDSNCLVWGYRGSGSAGVKPGRTCAADYPPSVRFLPAGDFDGDGTNDLLIDDDGTLRLKHGSSFNMLFLSDQPTVGAGWGTMRFIAGGADFSGDGRPDVVGVASSGAMYLYRGDGRGHLVSKTQINSGWGSMVAVLTPGDFDGDRRADVLAVDPAGVLWLYPGNGRGGLQGTRSRVGNGWATMAGVLPLRDFTGDGRADLGGLSMDGKLYVYAGTGHGSLRSKTLLGAGWQRYF